ncbi:MAG: T9SS type A sorting domain-containing protein [Bacteroidota bacterium]
MKKFVAGAALAGVLGILWYPSLHSNPSFNGTAAGCGGSGCHTFQTGLLSVTQPGGLGVEVAVSGTTSRVAGELVDSAGTVVAAVNSTNSNPFLLTAPGPGRYRVNAGFRSPSRRWDSTGVVLVLTGVEQSGGSTTPSDFRLDQNYPNPFNPLTTIGYYVPSSGRVSLKVFDSAGEEVAHLVDHWQEAGRHSVAWDGTSHPSGVYFYRLTAGKHTEARKLVLLR